MPLHVSSTVVLIIRRSELYYTASGIVTLCRWPSGALSWSVSKVTLRYTVSKISKYVMARHL